MKSNMDILGPDLFFLLGAGLDSLAFPSSSLVVRRMSSLSWDGRLRLLMLRVLRLGGLGQTGSSRSFAEEREDRDWYSS